VSKKTPARNNRSDGGQPAVRPETPHGNAHWRHAALREPAALLLAATIVMRPFLDGITFPHINSAFVMGIAACFAVWAACQLFRGPHVALGLPEGLFAALLGVMLVTGLNTTQVDGTYRALLNWGGFFLLFLVSANVMRNKTLLGLLLGLFVAVNLAEALWSLVHLEYILPMTRAAVLKDPALLRTYFGTDVLTPDIADRLNMNRAFGTFLFPNALGAFMAFGVVFGLGAAGATWHALRSSRPTPPVSGGFADRLGALAVAIGAGAVLFGAGWFLYWVAYTVTYENQPWTAHPWGWVFFVGVLPLAGAGSCFALIAAGGLWRGWLRVQLAVLALLALTALAALWFTASRGAMIGVATSLAVTGGLLAYARSSHAKRRSGLACALVALLMGAAAFASFTASPAVWAQEEAAPASTATLDARTEGIAMEGVAPTLASGATFRLRLSYWRTGLSMFLDNPLSGVGLGNFGVNYPRYQSPAAGNVKQAHNDFLQMFCETGLGGGLLFLAFWGYYLAWGGVRIFLEPSASQRWLLAALYAATLSFLVHSAGDFNFSNPSLATFQYFLAGAFLAVSRGTSGTSGISANRVSVSLVLGGLLVLAMFAAGAALRAHRSDSLFGRDVQHNALFAVAQFFFEEVKPETYRADQAPAIGISEARALLGAEENLASIGVIHVPIPNGARPLAKDEPPPPGSYLIISNPSAAQQKAKQAIMAWMARVKTADWLYPHNPDIAQHLFNWNQYLASIAKRPDERREHILEALEWAEKNLARNLYLAQSHSFYAMALRMRAEIETGPKRAEYYEKALEHYRKATELAPSGAWQFQEYGEALELYGKGYESAGNAARAAACFGEARKAKERAQYLNQEAQKRGL